VVLGLIRAYTGHFEGQRSTISGNIAYQLI
jgi:hypothetical protein